MNAPIALVVCAPGADLAVLLVDLKGVRFIPNIGHVSRTSHRTSGCNAFGLVAITGSNVNLLKGSICQTQQDPNQPGMKPRHGPWRWKR